MNTQQITAKYYAIIGRLCGADEDSCFTIEADSKAQAQEIFQARLLKESGYDSLEAWLEDNKDQYFSEDDTGIYTNHILVSDSPIQSVYSFY